MPKSLFKELKSVSRSQHFLDMSEQLRSIVRKKWMENTNPELFELKNLRREINEEVKRRSLEKIQEQVNKELETIKKQLKRGKILDE